MGETGDRMDRAGRYVLGLMDDEERERAERDLEIDPAFREALVTVAERMHVFDRPPAPAEGAPGDGWRLLKEHIDSMPQMRPAPDAAERATVPSEPVEPKATFGRRRSDRPPPLSTPDERRASGIGLHALPARRALVFALCLVAAGALGYVAGISSLP